MPTHPLPSQLITRLQELVKKKGERRAITFLGKLTNVDHRRELRSSEFPARFTDEWGFRVRELKVARQFKETKSVVIKRTHGSRFIDGSDSGRYIIDSIVGNVRFHNQKISSKRYVLKEPIAYAIGENLIAMSKTDCPSIEEVIRPNNLTPRGRHFFETLQSKNKSPISLSEKLTHLFWSKKMPLTVKGLQSAYYEFNKNYSKLGFQEIGQGNLLLLGYENGKFVFMPLVDLF